MAVPVSVKLRPGLLQSGLRYGIAVMTVVVVAEVRAGVVVVAVVVVVVVY